MGQQCAGDARRAPLFRFARRTVVLAALGTGLWLGGQATASAEEIVPPSTPGATSSSAVGEVAAPGVELLGPATSAAAFATGPTAPPVTSAAEQAPAAVAPVAPVPVAPVVSAAAPVAHSVAVPVTDLADPIVQAAEPVLEVPASLGEVAAPVVAAVEQAVFPVADAVVPLAGALDPLRAPAADALSPVLVTGLNGAEQPTDADFHRLTRAVHGPAAGTAGAGRVMAPAGDDVITPGPGAAGGVPVPVRPPTPASGGSARAACTGAGSFDHSPADLSAAVLATITAALAATGDSRDAARSVTSDPSFSPD